MKPIGSVFAAAVLAAVLWQPAAAQDAEALAVARELVAETTMDGMVGDIVARTWPAMEPEIRRQLPDASAEAMKGFRADYVRIVTERTGELMAETPAVYARHYTAEELRQLVAFYRSPVGRKSLAVMPAIVGDMVKIATARMPMVTAEINEAFRTKMRKKGVEIPI
ncbi:DUF2059 domain-containing protein [Chenggangzhangella methanolivorans]|uniref:DUF2059 domain-containing protein n=1 Tax=Chenggangzhangella methanolivorans TaxID=1437009 RepID=A0A9E6R848_9HYPH|nr:DUF2059 domain-containing protein [Chenggangzhangella methanolivorans]QZN98392.1 DUF2059 domain-containing protein [Chenggangzhangella methanolivorans]